MKVSAYIPCFNNSATLARAVESIRRQTVAVDELFVVDDGSTDGSADLSRELGVRVISHTVNSGRGGARARATLEAAHQLVLACDAGIALPPGFLENARSWMEESRVAAVFGSVCSPVPRNATERWRSRHLFKAGRAIAVDRRASLATGGVLLRKEAVLRVGNFAADQRCGEDAELGARLLAAGFDVVCDPALQVLALGDNSLPQLLERYERWNAGIGTETGLSTYARQVGYALKVMVREDLRHGDLASAGISFLCPHYLFWKTRFRRRAGLGH